MNMMIESPAKSLAFLTPTPTIATAPVSNISTVRSPHKYIRVRKYLYFMVDLRRPMLLLSGEDDPVVPPSSIPVEKCSKNKHTVLVLHPKYLLHSPPSSASISFIRSSLSSSFSLSNSYLFF